SWSCFSCVVGSSSNAGRTYLSRFVPGPLLKWLFLKLNCHSLLCCTCWRCFMWSWLDGLPSWSNSSSFHIPRHYVPSLPPIGLINPGYKPFHGLSLGPSPLSFASAVSAHDETWTVDVAGPRLPGSGTS